MSGLIAEWQLPKIRFIPKETCLKWRISDSYRLSQFPRLSSEVLEDIAFLENWLRGEKYMGVRSVGDTVNVSQTRKVRRDLLSYQFGHER